MIRATDLIEVSITSTLIAFLLTPFMAAIAARTGYLDHPRDNKRHAHSTPLLGGVAIFIAFIAGTASQWDVIGLYGMNKQIIAMLLGTIVLFGLGLIDDKIGMGPNIKLFGQFVAAMIIYKSGLRIAFLDNYYLSLVVTYLWIVGITNSFNLLDNMNGLSAGVAAIASLFFGVVSLVGGGGIVAIVSFCLCGACLGFLAHNFPKAKIFMGDTGSLIIGFVLATTAILGKWKSSGLATSLAIPILILAYPIFDTTLVTIIRILERRSIFQGGKDHSSHRLALLGLKSKGAVLVIYLICAILGSSALFVSVLPFKKGLQLIFAIVAVLILFGIRLSVVNTGRFGRKKGPNNGNGAE